MPIRLGGSQLSIQARKQKVVLVVKQPRRELPHDPVRLALGLEGQELRCLGLGLPGAAAMSRSLSIFQWAPGQRHSQSIQLTGKPGRPPANPWKEAGALMVAMEFPDPPQVEEAASLLFYSPIPITLNGRPVKANWFQSLARLEYRHFDGESSLGQISSPLLGPAIRLKGSNCPFPGPFVVLLDAPLADVALPVCARLAWGLQEVVNQQAEAASKPVPADPPNAISKFWKSRFWSLDTRH